MAFGTMNGRRAAPQREFVGRTLGGGIGGLSNEDGLGNNTLSSENEALGGDGLSFALLVHSWVAICGSSNGFDRIRILYCRRVVLRAAVLFSVRSLLPSSSQRASSGELGHVLGIEEEYAHPGVSEVRRVGQVEDEIVLQAARKPGLTVAEIEDWQERFGSARRMALCARARVGSRLP